MSDKPKPNDRPESIPPATDEKPEIYVVIGKDRFPRPALETYFADSGGGNEQHADGSCKPVAGVFCSCNKVKIGSKARICSCVAHRACSCVGHNACSCVSNRSSSGGGYGCRCAPVH